MNAERLPQALASLQARGDNERLQAARTILEVMTEVSPEIAQAVSAALARETVPWVRGALAEILSGEEGRILQDGVVVPAPSWDRNLEGLDADVARQVINVSTRRVLHEVSAVVGRAKLAARADFPGAYVGSETSQELDFLSDVCDGLRTLSAATQTPQATEFDLSEELENAAEAARREMLCPVQATGPSPFIVITDRTLLRLAVKNVLVNAIEATLAVGAADDSRAVVLSWGVSPDGFHTTVIDRGPGPPAFLATLRSAGVSTKQGHPGYGLATASEAMKSLNGTVEIRRNDRGGATVVLAWKEIA